jgi:hypothetical protein
MSGQLRPGAVGDFLAEVPEVPKEPGARYGTQHNIEINLDGRRYDV